jgi:superfamily II DNA or RNA helicase
MGHAPLRPGDVVRIRDERWSVTRHVEGANGALLDVCGGDRENRGVRASFVLPCEPCERLPRSNAPRLVRPRTWRRRVRAALANATPAPDALRTRARDTLALLPFQLEPALAITRGHAARILIADEVGLGKTIQAGLVVNEVLLRRPDGHALVVTPAGLRAQWCDELNVRLGIDATVLDSPALARHGWMYGGNPWSTHRVVITSLDYVKRPEVLRSLEAMVWDIVVFDEAHALTGRSDRAAAAGALSERARTVVMLTATPHSGDDEAFTRLCGTGDLQRSFPLSVFRRTRTDVGFTAARRTISLRVRPTLVEAEMHRAVAAYTRLVWAQQGRSTAGARLVAMVLCRRAFSSAASLARSIERRLMLLGLPDRDARLQARLPFDDATDDDEPAALLAVAGLDDAREERAWLELLLELARRAALDESKLRTLERYLRRAHQPVIVFTEYRDTLATLSTALADRSPLLLHGGMPAAERHDSARRFNEGESSVLLATDAASEGLNLHRRCRLVINLELPWTPVRLEQRIGRVERIGQTRRVHAVHLLASGTSEEQAVARLLIRARQAARALSEITPLADSETAIADAVIGGIPPAPRSAAVPVHHGPAPDLHAAAQQEAGRLELLRLLASDSDPLPSDPRPCVTVLRRNGIRRAYWLYRLPCVDRELQVAWEALTAFTADVRTHASCWRDIGTWLATPTTDLLEAVSREHRVVFAGAATALQAANGLSARRERAIEETLAFRHARLSAAVIQRGLFDRRGERAAASQRAVIEQALERCRARLRELDALAAVAPDEMSLAFALLFR